MMSLNPEIYPPLDPVTEAEARPFWTVIVPAYKPDYLPQTLGSLMNQDPGPAEMEILILDDCSPHELEPIVRQICGQRAQYIRQPRNLGCYINENDGLARSRGLWIHFLNDDDWVLPGFYETFHTSLKDQPQKVGVACCWQANVDASGKEMWRQPLLRETPGILDNLTMQLSVANLTHPVGTVIRRSSFEHLGCFCTKLTQCADWEFNRRAAVFYDWWYEPQLLACYRQHSGSATAEGRLHGTILEDLRTSIEISQAYLPLQVRSQLMARSREACGSTALRMAAGSLQRGDLATAIHQIRFSLEMSNSPRMLEQLANVLTHPSAGSLRELVGRFFKTVSISDGSKSVQSDSALRK